MRGSGAFPFGVWSKREQETLRLTAENLRFDTTPRDSCTLKLEGSLPLVFFRNTSFFHAARVAQGTLIPSSAAELVQLGLPQFSEVCFPA